MRIHIFFVSALLLMVTRLGAQSSPTIYPQVLNAAGGHHTVGTSGISITDNIGEPFTQSSGYGIASMMITEGFIQPETVIASGFTVTPIQQNQTCTEINDGMISLDVTSTVNKYDVKYLWTSNGNCPNNDCNKLDSLKPGIYTVTVAVQYTTNVGIVKNDSIARNFVIDPAAGPCIVKPFSGVSSNNDNNNDFFTIENISGFPDNHVWIFNRWGNLLFDVKGYDQALPGKRWPEGENLSKTQSSTYFYIIELTPGGNPIKGWVELIKD